MQWTIAAKDSIEGNHNGFRLDVEYCLPGIVDVEAKGTNVGTALSIHRAWDSGDDFAPADKFDCVNKPLYGCSQQVNRAGAKCPRCIAEKLMPGGRLALPSVSSYDQYGTAMPKHDPEPADIDFDCVNKPIYDCPEQVSRAGAKCSECVANKRQVLG